jgi:hypothetical protein
MFECLNLRRARTGGGAGCYVCPASGSSPNCNFNFNFKCNFSLPSPTSQPHNSRRQRGNPMGKLHWHQHSVIGGQDSVCPPTNPLPNIPTSFPPVTWFAPPPLLVMGMANQRAAVSLIEARFLIRPSLIIADYRRVSAVGAFQQSVGEGCPLFRSFQFIVTFIVSATFS